MTSIDFSETRCGFINAIHLAYKIAKTEGVKGYHQAFQQFNLENQSYNARKDSIYYWCGFVFGMTRYMQKIMQNYQNEPYVISMFQNYIITLLKGESPYDDKKTNAAFNMIMTHIGEKKGQFLYREIISMGRTNGHMSANFHDIEQALKQIDNTGKDAKQMVEKKSYKIPVPGFNKDNLDIKVVEDKKHILVVIKDKQGNDIKEIDITHIYNKIDFKNGTFADGLICFPICETPINFNVVFK